jgi:U11/U12 small nuclear ribonucleoprotein SNRNP48
LWVIRAETDAWTTHYPAAYSHPVLRAISGAAGFKNTQLMDWLITNSPRYGGVVIDVAMRDHIFLLFRLCLEAIIKEAVHYQEMNDSSTSFECPVLVQALMWLASQLSILYGEMNGKLFAIHMLKQCVLEAATLGLLFTIDTEEGSRVLETDGTVAGEAICVSQVEAAVSALRERALLEENIKGLQVSQPLNRSLFSFSMVLACLLTY